MTLKPLASWGTLLTVLSVVVIAPGTATAASPPVEAAIKTLDKIPADAAKFTSYCNLLGDMESVPDTDAAKYEAIESQLDAVIDSYGADVVEAWDTLSEIDPETDDGKAVAAAFEAIEGKCP
jgi:hypothetical protein